MGERLFVAPMGEVGEILHEPRYTQLPGVKNWVKGVANEIAADHGSMRLLRVGAVAAA